MQHDLRLRAAARVIYDNVYPAADPTDNADSSEKRNIGAWLQEISEGT